MRLYFFLFMITLSGCSLFKHKQEPVPALKTLLNELSYYKLNNEKRLHAGDLLQHSLWTHFAATGLFEDQTPWTSDYNFTKRDQELLSLAALLHDIGKAGRGDLFNGSHKTLQYRIALNDASKPTSITYSSDHEEHVQVGFDYLAELFFPLGKAPQFFSAQAQPISFQPLFTQLNITLEEQKLVAILVGMHYSFGKILRGDLTFDGFLNQMKQYATFVQYKNINERLLRLCVLIQIADVTGMSYVQSRPTWLLQDPDDYPAQYNVPSAYERFGYNTDQPLVTFHKLIERFKQLQAS
jgi:putative nucleotidyltransferase with HDIG domain